MAEYGRGAGGVANEDRLPWLEPVEEDRRDEGVSALRLIFGLIVALVVLGLIVGGVYWLKQRASGSGAAGGDSRLIAAAPGPYKVKPAQPGGMKVQGQGDVSYAASQGADANAPLDLSAVPEQPVARPAAGQPAPAAANQARPAQPAPNQQHAAPPPTRLAQATPAKQAPAKPAATVPVPAESKPVAPAAAAPAKPAPVQQAAAEPAPAKGGAAIQLGAFSSQAKAHQAWKSLSGRFQYLAPLTESVVAAQVGGKTIYRLRAAGVGGQAGSICSKLRVAGETCLVVG